jgi:predicted metal-dependent hydrolase
VIETITVGGLSFTVSRRHRRTLEIRVERDGTLAIAAPDNVSIERIRRVAENKAPWAYKKLAQMSPTHRYRPKEFVSGESFEYLGRRYRLRLTDTPVSAAPTLRLVGRYFELHRSAVPLAKRLFTEWYVQHGDAYVREKVESLAMRFEPHSYVVRVRDLGRRWGSCSPLGVLNINWRIVMAPAAIIEYVVVHELAHLSHSQHDQTFWRSVARVVPDHDERRAWLREHGALLDL